MGVDDRHLRGHLRRGANQLSLDHTRFGCRRCGLLCARFRDPRPTLDSHHHPRTPQRSHQLQLHRRRRTWHPRSLLTSRLREPQRVELVETTTSDSGRGSLYRLSAAGEDLADVLQAIGKWGERWLEVAPAHADPGYLLNAWCTTYLATDQLPPQRVVVRFGFTDQPRKATPLWIIFRNDEAEVCRNHPGYEEDLTVEAESVAIAEWSDASNGPKPSRPIASRYRAQPASPALSPPGTNAAAGSPPTIPHRTTRP